MSTSLEEALGEANPDSSAVRELVRESGGVPDELRGKLWQVRSSMHVMQRSIGESKRR